jgi:hypothetical protein
VWNPRNSISLNPNNHFQLFLSKHLHGGPMSHPHYFPHLYLHLPSTTPSISTSLLSLVSLSGAVGCQKPVGRQAGPSATTAPLCRTLPGGLSMTARVARWRGWPDLCVMGMGSQHAARLRHSSPPCNSPPPNACDRELLVDDPPPPTLPAAPRKLPREMIEGGKARGWGNVPSGAASQR